VSLFKRLKKALGIRKYRRGTWYLQYTGKTVKDAEDWYRDAVGEAEGWREIFGGPRGTEFYKRVGKKVYFRIPPKRKRKRRRRRKA